MAAHKEDLVGSLESSLQACVSLLVTDNVEKDGEKEVVNKSGVEACIKKFLESAKTLEADFLKKQMYSRLSHPQEATKEEVEKMRAELAQKEELLSRVNQKVARWANALQDIETRQTRLQLADSVPQRTAATLDAYSMDTSR